MNIEPAFFELHKALDFMAKKDILKGLEKVIFPGSSAGRASGC
jgi:hypothetical protein